MPEHYFTPTPQSAADPRFVDFCYRGRALRFETDSGTFSRGRVDPGSALLLEAIGELTGPCADIGCGWGAMGLSLAAANPGAHITMVDINERAVELARRNAELNQLANVTIRPGDGLSGIDGPFALILTNPPIRAGKEAVYSFFAQAAEKLSPGGAFYAVIRKQQGAPSAQKHLAQLFGNCRIVRRGGGYHVLQSVK